MAKNKLELTWVGKDERPRLPWSYLLVPESRIDAARTFASVAAEHAFRR